MSTHSKVMKKNAEHKLTLLQLAEKLGSVSAACRHMDYSRSQFYEIKRRFQLEGFQGLIDRPPIPKSHPHQKSQRLVDQVLTLTRQYPARSHLFIAAQLRLQGAQISAGTVRNIWKKRGLQRRFQRWLWVEQHYRQHGLRLTEEQVKELERLNPCLRERHVESSRPGYLLCQDTFGVGYFKGIGRVYLQAVIDTYCSLGFAKLYTSKEAITAADLLHDRVIPFYQDHQTTIEHILTDNGREYCGRQLEHDYELLLVLHGIRHRRTRVARPRTNGFVERFNRTLLDEFFRGILRRKFYTRLSDLQEDLDRWLIEYNTQRPHQGYRNMGKTPMASFSEFKEQKQAA